MVGDIFVLTKNFSIVERGDIVTSYNEEMGDYGKRVIALGGETVSFKGGHVYINGVKLEEPYLESNVGTYCPKVFEVPEDSVFLMGDNRFDSYDSRYWENPYLPVSEITGKYLGTIYHKKDKN